MKKKPKPKRSLAMAEKKLQEHVEKVKRQRKNIKGMQASIVSQKALIQRLQSEVAHKNQIIADGDECYAQMKQHFTETGCQTSDPVETALLALIGLLAVAGLTALWWWLT